MYDSANVEMSSLLTRVTSPHCELIDITVLLFPDQSNTVHTPKQRQILFKTRTVPPKYCSCITLQLSPLNCVTL